MTYFVLHSGPLYCTFIANLVSIWSHIQQSISFHIWWFLVTYLVSHFSHIQWPIWFHIWWPTWSYLVTNLNLHFWKNLVNIFSVTVGNQFGLHWVTILVSHLAISILGLTFGDHLVSILWPICVRLGHQFGLTFGDDFDLIFGSHSLLNFSPDIAVSSNIGTSVPSALPISP